MIVLKNTTVSDIDLEEIGLRVPASGQITISVTDYASLFLAESIAEITPYINSGDIVVNNGSSDFSALASIGKLSFFNLEHEFFFADVDISTTSNQWESVLDQDTKTLPLGNYLFIFQCEFAQSLKQRDAGVQFSIGGTVATSVQNGVSVNNDYETRTRLLFQENISGVKNLLVEYGQTIGGGTMSIRNVMVGYVRLS